MHVEGLGGGLGGRNLERIWPKFRIREHIFVVVVFNFRFCQVCPGIQNCKEPPPAPCFEVPSPEFSASVWILSPFRKFNLNPEDFYTDKSNSVSVNLSNSQERNSPELKMLTVNRKFQ